MKVGPENRCVDCNWPSYSSVCVHPKSLSRVQLCATRQAPLSMGFSGQGYWSGLPFPPPEDLPDPRMEPVSLTSPALAGGSFTTGAPWEAPYSRQTVWKLLWVFQAPFWELYAHQHILRVGVKLDSLGPPTPALQARILLMLHLGPV